MRILITGGAGFIGSHLAEGLLSQGNQVSVLDDLSTGRMANIEHLVGQPGFEHRVGSAVDPSLVCELMDGTDCTVHLAAAVGVRLIIEEPVHTIETNVRATEVVLNAAADQRHPVIVASTSEVYGKSTRVPFHEDDDLNLGATTRSRWAYACSKALDEWLAFAYQHEKGVPVTVVRLFNTVGPRQVGRYGMVLPTFVRQALLGEPLTVYGDGNQSRCFAHVKDVVQALIALIPREDARGEVFNVGSDREVSIRELAEIVKARVNSDSEIVCVPYSEAYAEGFEDMPRRVPDVGKFERLTGFRPTTSLEAIIDDVIEDQGRYISEA